MAKTHTEMMVLVLGHFMGRQAGLAEEECDRLAVAMQELIDTFVKASMPIASRRMNDN